MIANSSCDERLKVLMPYYQRDTLIINALTNESIIEKYKFLSATFPYNGLIVQILASVISHGKDENLGFYPLEGELKIDFAPQKTSNSANQIPQERQIDYLYRILNLCKANNIKLIFTITPIYLMNNSDEQINNEIICIAQKEQIPILNFTDSTSQFSNAKLFKDKYHLNIKGATIFSELVSKYVSKSEIKYRGGNTL